VQDKLASICLSMIYVCFWLSFKNVHLQTKVSVLQVTHPCPKEKALGRAYRIRAFVVEMSRSHYSFLSPPLNRFHTPASGLNSSKLF
jgi:hypothetical protein